MCTYAEGEPKLPILWYLRVAWVPLLVAGIVGAAGNAPASRFSILMNETFKEHAYSDAGYISASTALFDVLLTPVLASASDGLGRRPVMFVLALLTAIPPLLYVITADFFYMVISDIFLGMGNIITTLNFALIADLVSERNVRKRFGHDIVPPLWGVSPALKRARSLAMGTTMGVYLVLMAAGSSAGSAVSTRGAFIISVAGWVLIALLIFFGVDSREEGDHAPGLLIAAADGTGGVFANDGEHSPLLANVNDDDVNSDAGSGGGGGGSDRDEQDVAAADGDENDDATTITVANRSNWWLHIRRSWHLLRTNHYVQVLALISTLNTAEFAIFSGTIIIFLQQSLDFTKDDISHFMVVAGLSSFLFLPALFLLSDLGKQRNVQLLQWSIFGNVVMCACYGAAPLINNKIYALLAPFSGVLGVAAKPVVSSIAAQLVPPEQLGVAEGIIGSARAAASVWAPIAFTQLFEYALHNGPKRLSGWPFLVGSGASLIGLVVAMIWLRPAEKTLLEELEEKEAAEVEAACIEENASLATRNAEEQ